MGISNQLFRKAKWQELQSDNMVIIKRGQLQKQSKYIKQWRNRNVMLVKGYLMCFKQDTVPTALLSIKQINTLTKFQEENYHLLRMETKRGELILLRTHDQYQRDQWFQCVKEQKIKWLKSSNLSLGHIDHQKNILFLDSAQGKL